jgi:hypothetical protein
VCGCKSFQKDTNILSMRHNLHICILLFVISFTNPSYLLAVTYTAIFCSLRGYCISLSSSDVFRHAEGLLKRFGSQGDEGNVSQQELTVRSNMQRSMAKKLQGLSMAFRGSQKEHRNRLQAQKSGSGAGAFDFISSEKKSTIGEVDNGEVHRRELFS